MISLGALSAELEALVARTTPAVVGIEHRRGHGSGAILTPDGYVLTNAHVVDTAKRVRVGFADGETLPGRVVGTDDKTDLAVVKVQREGLPALALHEEVEPRVGQIVVAIGDPLSLERSVTLGIVSALERSLAARRGGLLEGLIQTDAAVNPGNSGGPLVDTEGVAVGINTAAVRFAQGISFAVSARTATWVASELIRHGRVERPRLGVAARSEPLGARLAGQLGQDRAVRILEVAERSPAQRAGLRDGDLVLQANGKALRSIDDLQRVMVLGRPLALALDVWRGARRSALVAELRV